MTKPGTQLSLIGESTPSKRAKEDYARWGKAWYEKNKPEILAKRKANKKPMTPEQRAVINVRRKAWREKNRERELEKRRAAWAALPAHEKSRIRAAQRASIAKLSLEEQRARRKKSKEAHPETQSKSTRNWRTNNRERYLESQRDWRKRNQHATAELKAKRRATLMQRKPAWLSLGHRRQIVKLYVAARQLSESGVPHTVDHICPLQNKVVCGLHVPWNLQVLSRVENAKKHNKFDELASLPAFI